jgi:hypothetical protein
MHAPKYLIQPIYIVVGKTCRQMAFRPDAAQRNPGVQQDRRMATPA